MTLPNIDRPILLRGIADRIRRRVIVDRRGLRTGRYFPIEIKRYGALTIVDYVQMDIYIWLLRAIDADSDERGEFWLGRDAEGRPLQRVTHRLNERRLFNALTQAAEIALAPAGSPLITRACESCHWLESCRRQPDVAHDVALIPGVQSSARESLHAAGLDTLAQVAASTPEHLRTMRGIKTTAEAHHAAARAWVSESPVWFAAPDPREAYVADTLTSKRTRTAGSRGASVGRRMANPSRSPSTLADAHPAR